MGARDSELPDLGEIDRGLKDFQRRTAAAVFHRLYEQARSTHRFLVADEVGLGKTLIARSVIARTLHHLWDRVDRIDIVYICSNAEAKSRNTASPVALTPNPSSQRSFAARDATSRGTKLPNAG